MKENLLNWLNYNWVEMTVKLLWALRLWFCTFSWHSLVLYYRFSKSTKEQHFLSNKVLPKTIYSYTSKKTQKEIVTIICSFTNPWKVLNQHYSVLPSFSFFLVFNCSNRDNTLFTCDLQWNGVLLIIDAHHNFTAIKSRVAGPQPSQSKASVVAVLTVPRQWHTTVEGLFHLKNVEKEWIKKKRWK